MVSKSISQVLKISNSSNLIKHLLNISQYSCLKATNNIVKQLNLCKLKLICKTTQVTQTQLALYSQDP